MSVYEENLKKFLNKSVVFESANGRYVPGTVLDVYKTEPNILIVLDQDGSEIEIDMNVRDVVIQ